MRVAFKKFAKGFDGIEVIFDDNERREYKVPQKMGIPHDAIHWIVERQLGLANGFWAHAARKFAFEEIGALVKEGGHASSSRAQVPSPDIVELIFAERIVECFEAEIHTAPSSPETFRSVLEAACRASFIQPRPTSDSEIKEVRARIDDFAHRWRALPEGGSIHGSFLPNMSRL